MPYMSSLLEFFFPWNKPNNNPLINPYTSLTCTHTMITHLHTLNANAQKSGYFPIVHGVPMVAYQTHVAQSWSYTDIKPIQQKSSLFSQDDPSCSPFLKWIREKKWKYITNEVGLPLLSHPKITNRSLNMIHSPFTICLIARRYTKWISQHPRYGLWKIVKDPHYFMAMATWLMCEKWPQGNWSSYMYSTESTWLSLNGQNLEYWTMGGRLPRQQPTRQPVFQ
jgi:hypothetical protein